MPTVTINGRTVEVPAGTNLVDAGQRVGVQIPHYCYHPRLPVVGQCRMCLVQIDGGAKLQAACSITIQKDGMQVRTDVPAVEEAQRGMMEFLLINHPLDCSICDQAGECGLQDYSFKHGQAYSRFKYEEKRTYPGRERIPLGPSVLLNMNRCIQCTRCVRFTQEISKTGALGFFNRGARAEIGVFPGKELDDELAGNVVDVCPVGALTSTQFRFAERVWYLDKKPSICTGCEVGCNITLEHRKGAIRRYKPRTNEAVNDHWMCDPGRISFRRYEETPRLTTPRAGNAEISWSDALTRVHEALTAAGKSSAFLGSAHLSTEEAYLVAKIADAVGSQNRGVWVEAGSGHHIPNLHGGVSGVEAGPNRRGAELAGLASRPGGTTAAELLGSDGAAGLDVVVVTDSAFGPGADDPALVAKLRRVKTLIVFGWADTALARAADVALPLATHAEQSGTFVNVQHRVQKFDRAFPAPGSARSGAEAFGELLARFGGEACTTAAAAFDRLASELPAFAGMTFRSLPATGALLAGAPATPATHS